MKGPTVALTAALAFVALAGEGAVKSPKYQVPGLSKPVYYRAEHPLEQGGECTLALISIHGWHGGIDGGFHHPKLEEEAKRLGVALYQIAPMFPTVYMMADAKVAEDGRAHWNRSWVESGQKAVRGKPADDWRGGGDAEGLALSSFDVIDRILDELSDARRYPKLRRIVLSGFSAGGQFVDRYAAVGRGRVREGVALDFVAMAPSSTLWPDSGHLWHWGLEGRPRYAAALSPSEIMAKLETRRIWRACGDADVTRKSLDVGAEAMSQGTNRYDRLLKHREYVKKFPKWAERNSYRIIPGIGHETGKAYADPELVRFVLGRPLTP